MPKIKGSSCPECGRKLDAAQRLAGKPVEANDLPEPGDVSICLYCNTGLAFDENLELRLATIEESEYIWRAICKTDEKRDSNGKTNNQPNSGTADR